MRRIAFIVSLAASLVLSACVHHPGAIRCEYLPDGSWSCSGS